MSGPIQVRELPDPPWRDAIQHGAPWAPPGPGAPGSINSTPPSDLTAARHAAAQMLGAYRPETEDEYRLAANIIGFSFHALEALSQAAAPDLPITRILRGSAVSLTRESQKAERRLGQLQQARRRGIPPHPAERRPEPVQPEPKTAKALNLIEDTGKIASAAKASGLTWTQAYELRQREARIAASRKRTQARVPAQAAIATSGAIPGQTLARAS